MRRLKKTGRCRTLCARRLPSGYDATVRSVTDDERQGVYAIRNIVSGRVYVGSTIKIRKRWGEHRSLLESGKHHSIRLQRSWIKHGADAFAFEILELIDETNGLLKAEQVWIDKLYAACPLRGFNVLATAGSVAGRSFSEEAIAKMSASRRGRTISPSTRLLISAALKGRPRPESTRLAIGIGRTGKPMPESYLLKRRGWKHTDAAKEKMRASHTGRTVAEETRKKISAKLTGRKVIGRKNGARSAETKAKISVANKLAYARKHAQETI